MPKHAMKIPALRAGRRVRWMFELSADVGEGVVHVDKTSKKPTRSTRTRKPARSKMSPRKPRVTAAVIVPSSAASSTSMVAAAQTPVPVSRTTAREMVAMAVIGVLVVAGAAAALIGYPRPVVAPAAFSGAMPVNMQPEMQTPSLPASSPTVAVAAPPQRPKAKVEKPELDEEQDHVQPVKKSSRPFVWPPPSMAAVAPPPAPEAVAPERSAAMASSTTDAGSPAVTITGCLEMTVDETQYRLTDTEGAAAPKSRSWRSGFLKKGSAAVDLVDLSDGAALRQHVGQRVAATGVLAGRQLRVRSFQSAGSSCD